MIHDLTEETRSRVTDQRDLGLLAINNLQGLLFTHSTTLLVDVSSYLRYLLSHGGRFFRVEIGVRDLWMMMMMMLKELAIQRKLAKLAKLPCHDAFIFKELMPLELNLEIKYIIIIMLIPCFVFAEFSFFD
ncbi:hypothetical protein NC652_029553 [Populus alba x Populus x berolinensis]|nr:hypothetical protein NC652_029553 [Populus alba x Populus x berolinensis]